MPFFMCELWKIFFLRNMIDNQCANICSTHVTIYGSHNGKFAFIERENIFLHVYPQLSFFLKLGLCLSFPHFLNFLQNCFSKTCFVFSIFIGGEKFFFLCHSCQGELLLFIGGVVSISYRVELFCVPLIFFLLSFIAYVYSLMSCLCQYVTKRGRFR